MATQFPRRALLGATLLLPFAAARAARYEVTLTSAQWRERLDPQAYAILREAATERAFTSPLNTEHRKGVFVCKGCALPLYPSTTKFDSGTGWPSFWRPLPNAVATDGQALLHEQRGNALHPRKNLTDTRFNPQAFFPT